MRKVFISGFRWSGSSALEELIQENFDISPVAGDELIFFSKGVLPIVWPSSYNFFERILASYFLDPLNNFGIMSPSAFWLLKRFVWIVSFRKKWIFDYHLRYFSWFGVKYKNNKALSHLVGDLKIKYLHADQGATIAEVINILNYLVDVILESAGDRAILLNNCIPARFSDLLSRVNSDGNNFVVCVRRGLEDQAREIKSNSFLGPILFKKLIIRNLKRQYLKFNDEEVLLVSFEDIVLDEKVRTKLLDSIGCFLGYGPRDEYLVSSIENSHLNITKCS